MAKRERVGRQLRGTRRLEALQAVGDERAARAEALRLLEEPGASDAEKEEARAALRRAGPERAAALLFLLGLLFYATVLFLAFRGGR
jgi:hypothetical protein